MSKILSDLKNQLQQNIIAHQDIINMSDDIIEIVQIINKKVKKGRKNIILWKWRVSSRCPAFSCRIYCKVKTSY